MNERPGEGMLSRSVAATECGEQLAPMFGAVGRTMFVWRFTTT